MNFEVKPKGTGSHGPSPTSAATRARLLAGLLKRADAGDVAAADALIRISYELSRWPKTIPRAIDTSEPTIASMNEKLVQGISEGIARQRAESE